MPKTKGRNAGGNQRNQKRDERIIRTYPITPGGKRQKRESINPVTRTKKRTRTSGA